MSPAMDEKREQRLDHYLDGLLDGDELAAFEREIAGDTGLRAEVDRQEAVSRALGRVFAPTGVDRAMAAISAETGTPKRSAARQSSRPIPFLGLRRLGLVASFVIGAIAVWRIVGVLSPEEMVTDSGISGWNSVQRSMAGVFHAETAADAFTPSWVCKDMREFAATFWQKLGQPLALAQLPTGVNAVGLSYDRIVSPNTLYLLATVGDERVIVFVDRKEREPGTSIAEHPNLKMYRGQVGDLAIYEVSRLDKAHFIEHFYRPADSEWRP